MGKQIDTFREKLPETIYGVAQVVADNPGQMALCVAGGIVGARMMANLVQPRNGMQALATLTVCVALGSLLTEQAIKRGILKFRVRDADGKLVPLIVGESAAGA
jgi:uncharacterized membrane protein HdeD (DUF308 family)